VQGLVLTAGEKLVAGTTTGLTEQLAQTVGSNLVAKVNVLGVLAELAEVAVATTAAIAESHAIDAVVAVAASPM